MGLRRWIRKYVYRLVVQEEELQDQATSWHRSIAVTPCVYCQRPIPPDSLFCKHCGFALVKIKQQTTGAQKLVTTLPGVTIPAMVLPGIPGMVLPETKIPGVAVPVQNVPTMTLPKPPLHAHILTNQIEAAHIPNEKYSRLKAYNRIKGKNV